MPYDITCDTPDDRALVNLQLLLYLGLDIWPARRQGSPSGPRPSSYKHRGCGRGIYMSRECISVGLPPPPPTVTSELIPAPVASANIAQPLTLSFVVTSDIDTDTGSYVHVSCPEYGSKALFPPFCIQAPKNVHFRLNLCPPFVWAAYIPHTPNSSTSPPFPDEVNSNSHVVGSILFSALPSICASS
jgi:hypothetical protein